LNLPQPWLQVNGFTVNSHSQDNVPDHPQLTPEVLVPRLGDYLLEKGLIDATNLQRALALQKSSSQPILLGKILVDHQFIDQASLDEAITEQIIQLRSALQDANALLERRVQERTAELEMAMRKLAEVNQLRANFVANLSHELRTPMTHLKGYLELMAGGDLGSLNEDQTHAIEVILKSTDRLSNLIEDLIMFAVSEKGQIALKLEQVDVCKLCQEAAAHMQSRANERNISLGTNLPEAQAFIEIDAEKMVWVIEQLLDNAVKFTAAGGKVSISARLDDNKVWFEVKDTGIGIPPDRVDEIFEPFYQLDGSSTRKYGGTGLGLALVRKIIEAHGTTIQVESQVGQGSAFRFPFFILKI
jgi:ammonium transporter, Amt family